LRCSGVDIKERERMADLCWHTMKKDIICAEGMMSCRDLCLQHSEMLEVTMKLLIRDSPVWRQTLRMCCDMAKVCVDECGKHDSDHCRDCTKACQQFMEATRTYASM